MKILFINGPNLNLLGLREPEIYGEQSYADLCEYCENACAKLGVACEVYHSNHEGCIVDKIQSAYGFFDGIVINPAAYTHTSIAIMDALKSVALPSVEVHLSELSQREAFRQHSYISLACKKTFVGLGFEGYLKAVEFLIDFIAQS